MSVRNFKSIFIISLLMILFIGNVGINIFKHVCSEDGTSISYFIQNEHECETHVVKEAACCHISSEKDDDCCSDSVEYFKVDLDFYQSQDDVYLNLGPALAANTFAFGIEVFRAERLYIAHLYDDPPIYSPKISRIKKQVFII